jgi:hypothetical protein
MQDLTSRISTLEFSLREKWRKDPTWGRKRQMDFVKIEKIKESLQIEKDKMRELQIMTDLFDRQLRQHIDQLDVKKVSIIQKISKLINEKNLLDEEQLSRLVKMNYLHNQLRNMISSGIIQTDKIISLIQHKIIDHDTRLQEIQKKKALVNEKILKLEGDKTLVDQQLHPLHQRITSINQEKQRLQQISEDEQMEEQLNLILFMSEMISDS